MKINPQTKCLYTDDGRLIKQLHCPYREDWSRMDELGERGSRRCGVCQHDVIDTAKYTEHELLRLLQTHPRTCLKVDLDQPNLTITFKK